MELEAIPNFTDWVILALPIFVSVACVVTFLGCVVGFVVAASRRGPSEGFYRVAQVMAYGVADIANFSFRRTFAMAMLAVQESIRRRVLIGFAVFVVIMLFAGWYLDVESDHPARLYLSFVLGSTNYVVLLLALFLSTFSLPNDIKSRTIYTIVTKPVRSLEIVFGRILGFSVVGTLLLLIMCGMSYLFVVRGLTHEHTVEEITEVAEPATAGENEIVWSGRTNLNGYHRHEVSAYRDGDGETEPVMGHRHVISGTGQQPDQYEVGRPVGMLQARVRHDGSLSFLDKAGRPGEGVNVGYENPYRSYIEGGTMSAAIWTFEEVSAERYPDGFDLELNLRVFRTYKGNIERGILGSISLQNPRTGLSSEPLPFVAKEFTSDVQRITRTLKAVDEGAVRDVDLYDDLTDEGRIQVVVRCSDPGQYYGMAAADVFILNSGGSFPINFLKGFVGIWLQMVLVNTFGVMFSTFLNGAVAMLATLATIAIGLFRQFVVEMFTGDVAGGGPIEAFIRVITQQNVIMDLEMHAAPLLIIQLADRAFLWFLWILALALPDYGSFSTADYVSYGYNISPALVTMNLLKGLAYVLIVTMIGYFFLKTREIAA